MRILGIDPGLAWVGYGVIDIQDGCQRMLDCGIIQTDSVRSDGDRMVEIAGAGRQLSPPCDHRQSERNRSG